MVSFAKLGSWFLLMIISYVLVAGLYRIGQYSADSDAKK